MTQSDLGPQPEPVAVPPVDNPGGVDAIEDTGAPPLPHDLPPEDNAALEDDEVPEEISEPDDKQQAPDDGAVSGETDNPTEPPA